MIVPNMIIYHGHVGAHLMLHFPQPLIKTRVGHKPKNIRLLRPQRGTDHFLSTISINWVNNEVFFVRFYRLGCIVWVFNCSAETKYLIPTSLKKRLDKVLRLNSHTRGCVGVVCYNKDLNFFTHLFLNYNVVFCKMHSPYKTNDS